MCLWFDSVPHTSAGWQDVSALLADSTFRDIVISLGATYGESFFPCQTLIVRSTRNLFFRSLRRFVAVVPRALASSHGFCKCFSSSDRWSLLNPGFCLFQIQYMILLPSFTNVLLIYSMCNLHDVSWGESSTTFIFVSPGRSRALFTFHRNQGIDDNS